MAPHFRVIMRHLAPPKQGRVRPGPVDCQATPGEWSKAPPPAIRGTLNQDGKTRAPKGVSEMVGPNRLAGHDPDRGHRNRFGNNFGKHSNEEQRAFSLPLANGFLSGVRQQIAVRTLSVLEETDLTSASGICVPWNQRSPGSANVDSAKIRRKSQSLVSSSKRPSEGPHRHLPGRPGFGCR